MPVSSLQMPVGWLPNLTPIIRPQAKNLQVAGKSGPLESASTQVAALSTAVPSDASLQEASAQGGTPGVSTTPTKASFTFQGQTIRYVADRASFDVSKNVRTLEGHVQVTYGEDVVTADRIEAHMADAEQFLSAEGHAYLVDPDGSLKAETLHISWNPANKVAFASKAEIRIAGAIIIADTVEVRPGVWTLTNFYATLDRARRPLFYVKGKRAVISPGHTAFLSDSQLYILGQRILGYQQKTFNLDPRATGLRFPTPEYRSGDGFGYDWSYSSPVGGQYLVLAHDSASRAELPSYGLNLVRDFVPVARDGYPIAPRSEFQMRFDFAYFDNIYVEQPSQEIGYMDRIRSSLNVESSINSGVTGRGTAQSYTVPVSVQYEIGGKIGKYANLADFKLEDIDQFREDYHPRAEWLDSFELPPRKLGENLFSMSRLDSGLYQSYTNYFWIRGSQS